jgi:hypothetical protein
MIALYQRKNTISPQEDIINEMKLAGFDLMVQDTTTLKYQYLLKFK